MASEPSLSWLERNALRFLMRQQRSAPQNDPWHLMNIQERRAIANIRVLLLCGAAVLGALGVVAYYVPVRLHPEWFPNSPLWGFQISVLSTIYSIFLGILEVILLTILNLWAVHRMAVICGFPDAQSPDYQFDIVALTQAGLEKRDKRLLNLGINPYYGTAQWSVALLNLLNLLKAMLSNLLVKLVVGRLLGRGVMRMAVDMVGIPIYAFWNAFAANMVIKEAKIRIMSPNLIDFQIEKLRKTLAITPEIQQALYDLLFLAATAKRRFHFAQYAFGAALLVAFQVAEKEAHETSDSPLTVLERFPKEHQKAVAEAFAIFLILDGRLRKRELVFAEALEKVGGPGPAQLKLLKNQYLRGEELVFAKN